MSHYREREWSSARPAAKPPASKIDENVPAKALPWGRRSEPCSAAASAIARATGRAAPSESPSAGWSAAPWGPWMVPAVVNRAMAKAGSTHLDFDADSKPLECQADPTVVKHQCVVLGLISKRISGRTTVGASEGIWLGA